MKIEDYERLDRIADRIGLGVPITLYLISIGLLICGLLQFNHYF